MLRSFLLAKIHGAIVTHANHDYEGSITISEDLLKITGMLPAEKVHVWNVTQGTRVETYILKGLAGSKEIAVNGAAAHHFNPGDKIIVATFGLLNEDEALNCRPINVFMNEDNTVKEVRAERLPE